MMPFTYEKAPSARGATLAMQLSLDGDSAKTMVQGRRATEFLAGGTTLLDLMKLQVMQPNHLIDLSILRRAHGSIEIGPGGVRLGAFATMAEVADHPEIKVSYPVLSQSLALAASAQFRNMATLGGNVLQRTRCSYFRDPSWAACNKRNPGSGCAALEGINRSHAVLGTSEGCIATYPGDWAQALLALDATVEMSGRNGVRTIDFADLHRLPGQTPNIETSLAPGEVITAFTMKAGPWTRRSLYLKIRDRQSYEFALTSAAVSLDLADGKVKEARIALGGVATKPWRASEAETSLRGKVLNEAAAIEAGRIAFASARPLRHNAFKVALGQNTIVRALLQAAAMEVRT